MNSYQCFYNGRDTVVQAETSFKAQQEAIKFFKPPKSKEHLVHVYIMTDEPQICLD